MGALIGSILDNIVYLVGVIFSIVILVHKKKGKGQFAKFPIPNWLIYIFILCYCFNLIISIPNTVSNVQNRPPNVHELAKQLNNEGKTVESDEIVQAQRGFEVLVPEGFTYVEFNDLMPFMMLNKESSASIVFEVLPTVHLTSQVFSNVKKNLSKYNFDDDYVEDIDLPPRIGFTVIKPEGLRKGEMFVIDYKDAKALIGTSTLEADWEESKDKMYQVIKSYKEI